MSKEKTLPIAYLEGVTDNNCELRGCSLVFHLRTPDGDTLMLTYAGLMESLEFAEKEKILPELPIDWWSGIGDTDACQF